jgi:hypothetical protein
VRAERDSFTSNRCRQEEKRDGNNQKKQRKKKGLVDLGKELAGNIECQGRSPTAL